MSFSRAAIAALGLMSICTASLSSAAAEPTEITYQGELLRDGVRISGIVNMKFAIVSGGTTLWSNDGTSVDGSEPTGSVPVDVDDSLFSVRLGASPEMVPLTASQLEGATNPGLRVWIEDAAGTSFEQLNEDQPISSVPFALRSGVAEAGGSGGDDGDWTIGTGAVYRVADNIGVGTSNPATKLHVHGQSLWLTGGNGDGLGAAAGAGLRLLSNGPTARIFAWDYDGGGAQVLSLQGPGGNLGIGTVTPATKLHVQGQSLWLTGGDSDGLDPSAGAGLRLFSKGTQSSMFAYDYGGGGPQDLILQAPGGNLGIGTTSPSTTLHVAGQNLSAQIVMERLGTSPGKMAIGADASGFLIGRTDPFTKHVVVTEDGDVGIGTATPMTALHVDGQSLWLTGGNGTGLDPSAGAGLRLHSNGTQSQIFAYEYGGGGPQDLILQGPGGSVGIGTNSPGSTLDVWGRTRTCVVEITGGCDIAEPFDVTSTEDLPNGALVTIAPDRPGHLTISRREYDTSVAGIVSGAGGVGTGLSLRHDGVMEGDNLIALAGRVYALATASNGAIHPGDLMTTSNIPGHAMKAIDQDRRQGAVIGKAMSLLESGEGLVLVLVQPQ